MKEVEFVGVSFEPSESIEIRGKRSRIEKYLKRGYYVKESRNGYWVLVKSAQAIVHVKDEDGKISSFDIRTQILGYYARKRLLYQLVDVFNNDAKEGKIKFYLDENNNLVIQ